MTAIAIFQFSPESTYFCCGWVKSPICKYVITDMKQKLPSSATGILWGNGWITSLLPFLKVLHFFSYLQPISPGASELESELISSSLQPPLPLLSQALKKGSGSGCLYYTLPVTRIMCVCGMCIIICMDKLG